MKKLLYLFLALSLIIPQVSFAKDYGSIDGKINDLMQVVSDSGELGSAVTSVTISNLDGDTDKEYELITRIITGTANAYPLFYVNNDSTAGHYGFQRITGSNTTVAGARATAPGLRLYYDYGGADEIFMSVSKIQAKSGQVRTCITKDAERISTTTVTSVALLGQSWNDTATNITSLVISGVDTNGLGVGSRIILLKKVDATAGKRYGAMNIKGRVKNTWQEVTRGTLGSATTSVTISNLTGNTDVLYRLRTRVISGDASNYLLLYPNNDSTAGIYGFQKLVGVNTTASAERDTSESSIKLYYGADWASGAVSQSETLIYAKSGYIRTFLNVFQEDSASLGRNLVFSGYSYNETSTEITSLVLTAGVSNGLGVGTFYVLEKLNLN